MNDPLIEKSAATHPPGSPASPSAAPRLSLAELLRKLVDDIIGLMRSELRLAGSEMRSNIASAVGGLSLVAIGLVLFSVATLCLLGALVVWLSAFVGLVGAALAVGIGALLVGFGLIYGGAAKLQSTDLAPRRAAANLKHNVERLKGE